MADYKLGFVGAYVSSAELGGGEATVKIARVALEQLEDERGQQKQKWILFFEGKAQGLVLNRTNAELIVALFGRDTEGWIGHWITLGVQKVRLGKEMVDGIRVVGSPEITAAKPVTVKLPRKKPQDVTLRPTGQQRRPAQQPVRPGGSPVSPAEAEAIKAAERVPGGEG